MNVRHEVFRITMKFMALGRIFTQHFKTEAVLLVEIQFEVRCKILSFIRPYSSLLVRVIAIKYGFEVVVKN